ncbi:hypothetical protein HK102_008228 [Quaeritorhiza haematococci]|nr:hypothetical protein HK102_008228 [Quaeritorhiza haematococci]
MSSTQTQKPQQPQFKVKQRKREAVTKYEPQVFRDALLVLIPDDISDFEKYSLTLETNAEKLDYKRYAEPFFEILIVGGLIAPGGTVADDGASTNPFSIFAAEDTQDAIRQRVDVIHKLVRRYKYLQRKLDETLAHLLQYVNKFGQNANKLATAVGILFSMGLASMPILASLFKEHLLKDGASLQFVTGVFKAYLEEHNMEHLATALKKSGLDNKLMEFFPPNKRTEEYLARHFEAEGLRALVEHNKKRQQNNVKDQVTTNLQEMFESGKTLQEVSTAFAQSLMWFQYAPSHTGGGFMSINVTRLVSWHILQQISTYSKQQLNANNWSESDIVAILWDAMLAAVDWGNRQEQIDTQLVKQLNTWAKIFVPFTTSPKTELGLLLKIQHVCYEDARFMKYFSKTLQILYNADVLSESAIIYWFEKGAASQGKTVFLKQTEAFVTWLKTEAEGSDEEEEDE